MFNSQGKTTMATVIRRDTGAWKVQVWVSFAIAAFLCGTGLAWLPGGLLEQAFMVMGYVFSLSTVFVLSKYVRDRAAQQGHARGDTPMWALVVWAGFAFAVALTGWGMWQMAIDPSYKAFLMVCWLYLLSSAFTLAKMLRDAHEDDMAEAASHSERV
ncbi:MAG: YiaA/YiaB family inner membrane protein [Aquabacterium sp.]